MQEAHGDHLAFPNTDTGDTTLIFLGCVVEVLLPGEGSSIEVAGHPEVQVVLAAGQHLAIQVGEVKRGGFIIF